MLTRTQNRFARTKGVVLLTGIVMVVLGIAVLVNPIGAVEALVRIIGFVLLAYGVLTLVNAFMKGDPVKNSPTMLVLGGIAAVLGLIMAIFPNGLVSFIWTIIGIIILLTGVLDIMEAGEFRSTGNPLAAPATASGVITAVLGAIVIICPMFSAALGMLVAAVALLVDGITEIIFGLGM
ncbi:MAG: DUF308 domain-containing protein [Atopobiaceae bacterium]|nr:DUF308 domain-containing protein [Atopobiaceae bacterium]